MMISQHCERITMHSQPVNAEPISTATVQLRPGILFSKQSLSNKRAHYNDKWHTWNHLVHLIVDIMLASRDKVVRMYTSYTSVVLHVCRVYWTYTDVFISTQSWSSQCLQYTIHLTHSLSQWCFGLCDILQWNPLVTNPNVR